MSRLLFLAVFVSLLLICSEAPAADYYVNGATGDDTWDGRAAVWDGVHGPKQTIQAGIDASAGGDTVTVADGTYTGAGNRDLDFHGKAIVLQSENGPETCIIDCQGTEAEPHRGFWFHSGEGLDSVVRGFTIRKGHIAGAGGGAILCESSSPTVTHCAMDQNRADGGGAIRNDGGSPVISDCIISRNTAYGTAGVQSSGGDLLVTRCRIVDNTGDVHASGGGISFTSGALTVTNCVIARNTAGPDVAGGIYCGWGDASISNCTITDNLGGWGGAVQCNVSDVEITRCILWGNSGDEVYTDDESRIVTYCDVQGGAGKPWLDPTTCIYSNPLLTPDAHLRAGSPCIDRSPTGPIDDVDGETRPFGGGYDFGADEFVDSDGDGLPDWWEETYYAEAGGDPDGDSLVNLDEYTRGADPGNPDTDGDGRDDGSEVASGTNPVHLDNLEKTYYVSAADGDDGYDGLAASFDGLHGPKATIQAGIDATLTGWGYEVRAADGTYTGPGNTGIDFRGKTIEVSSEHGAARTVIDCEGAARAFYFRWWEDWDSVLSGFTIRNAFYPRGAGISCEQSSPTVRHCVIADNRSSTGAGIYCWRSTAHIEECVIMRNCAQAGGGVYCTTQTEPQICGCTIAGNNAQYGGGICASSSTSSPHVLDCILWGNSPDEIYAAHDPLVSYCDVQNGTGQTWFDPATCIDVDPLLTPDGHLRAGSPCIDVRLDWQGTDIDGELRPWDMPGVGFDNPPDDRTRDIGADEFVDSDDDGLQDWWEDAHYADAGGDPDGDGLTNLDEYGLGTDPAKPDTDGDGRRDDSELTEGTDPLHPDNADKVYYVNGTAGDDLHDALAASWNGTHGPKATIQAGIDATRTGWGYTVLVADGAYTGPRNRELDLRGNAITVRSENGAERTVIDCEGAGRGFYVGLCERTDTVIQGFTVRNGAARDGGGIYCDTASPTISDCTITCNSSSGSGGGIMCWFGDPVITGCTITGNSAEGPGGGIGGYKSSVRISDCVIHDNSAVRGGGIYWYYGQPTASNCIIAENAAEQGGGIGSSYNTPIVTSCTVANNFAETGGAVHVSRSSNMLIRNTILWANAALIGHEATVGGVHDTTVLKLRYCDLQGGAAEAYIEPGCTLDMGTTNIDTDPLFVPGPLHQYYLSHVETGQAMTSPCVDAGSDTAANLGLDGLTTRQDGEPDAGVVDQGYHAPSAPYVYAITRSGDDITVWWKGRAGVSYIVEWSNDRVTWHDVAAGETSSWTDIDALVGTPAGAKRTYRVREVADGVASAADAGAAAVAGDPNAAAPGTPPSSGRLRRADQPTRPNVHSGGNVHPVSGNVDRK